jgi:hypothetical protein
MNRSLGFALIAFSIAAFPQSQKSTGKTTYQLTENQRLAVPVIWDAETVRIFKDSELNMTFHLTTSWIPGPDHKGMFRYKMGASPEKLPLKTQLANPDLYSPEAIEKLLKRTHECIISVDLFDMDGFVLRRFDVPFSFGVDGSAKIVGLTANDFIQMSADEYKNVTAKGGWSVSWLCDPLSEK